MKGSLVIVSFFVLGILFSLGGITPKCLLEDDFSEYILWGLMFFVGISIGQNAHIFKNIRENGIRVLYLPIGTIVGTLAGVAVASLFVNYSVWECMAVGSGQGYYSLSSIFITKYKGAELGTVALVSNIIREIIALLFAPMILVYFGKLAPIAAGGATTADTTLPIITKVSGAEFIVLSVIHGIAVDLSVPFLVTLFCTI